MPPTLTIDEIAGLGSPNRRACRVAGIAHETELDALHVYVDGVRQNEVRLSESRWKVDITITCPWEGRTEERGASDPEKAMVVVVASAKNGRSAAELRFV